MRTLLCMALAASLLVGCKDDDSNNDVPRPDLGTSYLRIVHASSQLGGVDFYNSYLGTRLPLGLGRSFGQAFPDSLYLAIEPTLPQSGSDSAYFYTVHAFSSQDTFPPFEKNDLAYPNSITLTDQSRQTLWLVDSLGVGTFVYTQDESPNYQPGDTAFGLVRFIHFALDGNYRVVASDPTFGSSATVGYGTQTGFQRASAGNVTFTVEFVDGTPVATQTFYVHPRKAATLWFNGVQLRRLFVD